MIGPQHKPRQGGRAATAFRTVMRLFPGLTAAIFAIFITDGTGRAADDAGHRNLTIGISQFPSTLHPSFDSMMAKSYIDGMAWRPITAYGPDWQVVCLLCVELPDPDRGTMRLTTDEEGRTFQVLTYGLRPDAVWGDGVPVSSADVAFSWRVGRDPETGIDNAELYRRIERVEILDDKRFALHFNKQSCDYRNIAGLTLLPEHIEGPIFAKGAKDYRRRSAYATAPATPGLWSGPYRVVAVEAGRHVMLERNPHWWGRPAAFTRITVRAVENTAALTANLLAGDIDMIAGELGLTMDQALALESRHGDDFRFVYRPGLVYEHLDVNLQHPALGERDVREALLRAIDREAINAHLFAGHQPVADSNVNPLDPVHDPATPRYGYDPDMAAELLDRAGWIPGPDGVRMRDGVRLSFALMTTAGNKTRELIQQILQGQWRELGIEAVIRNEPPRVFFGETVGKRRFDGMAMFAWMSAPGSIPRTTLHSDMIPSADNAWSGQNYTGYRSAAMDRIIDGLESDCAPDDQARLWREMQMLYAEALPALPLYFRANAYILPHWLHGLVPTGNQYPSSLWIEDWYVKE